MRHLLIDTDTASDDAVALVMALKYPGVTIEAITVVAGNVDVDQGVKNALYTVDLCQMQTKVYRGAAKPLLRELETAQHVHGQDGMGDIGLPIKNRSASEGNAIDVIIETIYKFPHQLEIITLGPLTNMAIAIAKQPEIVNMVKSFTVMGGVGYGEGNITPVSEYNMWADPEAARLVFQSNIPITMVGWDVAKECAWFDGPTIDMVRSLNSPLANFAMDIQKTVGEFQKNLTGNYGFHIPDPITVAIVLDDSIKIDSKKLYVDVVLSDDYTRGQTVVDHTGVTRKAANAEVVLRASKDKFLSLIKSTHS